MPDIQATFKSGYSESRHWVIVDQGRDPNSPPTIFDGYLDAGGITDSLPVYSKDGTYGQVLCQRSDGAATVYDTVTDGSQVTMD